MSYGSVIRAFDLQGKKQAELDTHSNQETKFLLIDNERIYAAGVFF